MVKAAPDREQRRMARISFASAACAGLLVLVGWALVRESPPPQAVRRSLDQAPMLWVCERNAHHHFIADGRYEPRPCPECGGQCFIQLHFQCPLHGIEFDALVQFEPDTPVEGHSGRPRERIVRYRRADQSEWHDAEGYVPCPVEGCTARTVQVHTTWDERKP